jgi:Large-conductance mechanosensitive channel, MscL
MLKGFKSFLMQGELVVIAVGLVVALAFSTLIKAFTDNIITPLVNAVGGGTAGLGVHVNGQLVNFGAFHFGDHLLRHLHGGDLLCDRHAIPRLHGQARSRRLRRSAADQDLSFLSLRGSAGSGDQVLALRQRAGRLGGTHGAGVTCRPPGLLLARLRHAGRSSGR